MTLLNVDAAEEGDADDGDNLLGETVHRTGQQQLPEAAPS